MKQIIEILSQFLPKFLDNVLQQGLALTLVLLSLIYSETKLSKLEKKFDNCQGQQLELLKTIVKDNTEAMSKFAEEMKERNK